jgi:hypothetical protein
VGMLYGRLVFTGFIFLQSTENCYLDDGEEGSDTREILAQLEGEVQKSDHQEDQNLRSE